MSGFLKNKRGRKWYILKKGRFFLGIGLVEVLWKMVEVILDCHLGTAITLQNVIHG